MKKNEDYLNSSKDLAYGMQWSELSTSDKAVWAHKMSSDDGYHSEITDLNDRAKDYFIREKEWSETNAQKEEKA